MATVLGLTGYKWDNNFKTVVLLATFPLMLLTLFALVFYCYGYYLAYHIGYVASYHFVQFGAAGREMATYDMAGSPLYYAEMAVQHYWPLVLGIAGVWVAIGYLFNSSIIHAATGAKPVSRTDAPKLYNLVENLCISRGMKVPKLFIMETDVMNAYASGINDDSYAITVTRGILDKLNDNELEAVLAHELTHIINRDCRLLIVTVVVAGMLSFMAQMLWRNMYYMGGGSRRDRGQGGMVLFLIAGVALIVGYVLALVLRFALSRQREYMADAGSIELTKSPESMISALRKISASCDVPHVPTEVRQMFIENPPSVFDLGGLFATHPPIEKRIMVLEQLAGQELPSSPLSRAAPLPSSPTAKTVVPSVTEAHGHSVIPNSDTE